MKFDPMTAALVAAIGGALSAGGLGVKLVDWLKSRGSNRVIVDAKSIDADLTVNERLLVRIATLELRSDKDRDELARAHAEIDTLQDELDRARVSSAAVSRIAANLEDDNAMLRLRVRETEAENRRLRDEVTGQIKRGLS